MAQNTVRKVSVWIIHSSPQVSKVSAKLELLLKVIVKENVLENLEPEVSLHRDIRTDVPRLV